MDCPFIKASEIIKTLKKDCDIIILDFHAETTSEKMAMGFYLDGLTSEKLSDLLGLTSDNVRQNKARALKKIRDIINKEND